MLCCVVQCRRAVLCCVWCSRAEPDCRARLQQQPFAIRRPLCAALPALARDPQKRARELVRA